MPEYLAGGAEPNEQEVQDVELTNDFSPQVPISAEMQVDQVSRKRKSTGGIQVAKQSLPVHLPDEEDVNFIVLEEASKNKKDVLISSDGYRFTCRRINKSSKNWQCSHRPKINPCPVWVIEAGQKFSYKDRYAHNHPGVPGLQKLALFRQTVLNESEKVDSVSASSIVEKAVIDSKIDSSLIPNLSNVKRAVNRARAKMRPTDPTAISDSLTHSCPPFQHLLSERLTSLGIMAEPRVPPLNPPETIVLLEHYRLCGV